MMHLHLLDSHQSLQSSDSVRLSDERELYLTVGLGSAT